MGGDGSWRPSQSPRLFAVVSFAAGALFTLALATLGGRPSSNWVTLSAIQSSSRTAVVQEAWSAHAQLDSPQRPDPAELQAQSAKEETVAEEFSTEAGAGNVARQDGNSGVDNSSRGGTGAASGGSQAGDESVGGKQAAISDSGGGGGGSNTRRNESRRLGNGGSRKSQAVDALEIEENTASPGGLATMQEHAESDEGQESQQPSASGASDRRQPDGGSGHKSAAADKQDGSAVAHSSDSVAAQGGADVKLSVDDSAQSVGPSTEAAGAGGSGEPGGQQPAAEVRLRKSPRKSRGPIQPGLLAAVEAAANDDGAVMLAVTNRDGALFQLPQLLASLRLVPQEDASRYLVVVTYSAPAQAACARQHKHCVLDDFGTGGLGAGVNGSVDVFAGWGSRQFKQITWRKIQLVQDILLQGYAVLSVDLDIALFKNPLDGAFNPWMNRELDVWTAIDNGRMLNCGFYFVRPTNETDEFMKTWLGRFNAESADEIWEQAEFNQILKGAHATMPQLRWEALNETWFIDLCFYLEARAVLPDQFKFGEQFAATSDKLGNWDQMFGFHAACCKGGGPTLPECKRSTATALMRWQLHTDPSEWP